MILSVSVYGEDTDNGDPTSINNYDGNVTSESFSQTATNSSKIEQESKYKLPFVLVNDSYTMRGRGVRNYDLRLNNLQTPINLNINLTTEGAYTLYIFPSKEEYNNWVNHEKHEMFEDCVIERVQNDSFTKKCGINGPVYISVWNRLEDDYTYDFYVTHDRDNVEISPLKTVYPE